MKWKRSQRLIDMTSYLLSHPHELTPLTIFQERYEVAKSSLSEDIQLLHEQFIQSGLGKIQTLAGAWGGVKYIPCWSQNHIQQFINELCQLLSDEKRLLPGGFFYVTDILGQPHQLDLMGRAIASVYCDRDIDVIMTIATKGIPIAQATAQYLNVPFIIVRRESEVSEGATVTINYESRNFQRVDKMELTRDSLKPGDRVLIVDDFLNGGGTLNGMVRMVEEFEAECIGAVVLGEMDKKKREVNFPYHSLLKIRKGSDNRQLYAVVPGTLLSKPKLQ